MYFIQCMMYVPCMCIYLRKANHNIEIQRALTHYNIPRPWGKIMEATVVV